MDIRTITFTKNGYGLAERLKTILPAHRIKVFYKGKDEKLPRSEQSLQELCEQAFSDKAALLFIGAMGIAIRHIAPFVKDKLTDPPVLVMDEKGRHVIPVLSGHVGGANALAFEIAENLGADPVITTATDLGQAFSVDLFAKEQGLKIVNREGIAKVSVKALSGKPVVLSVKGYPPEDPVDVIITDEEARFSEGKIALRIPEQTGQTGGFSLKEPGKPFCLGIGCKKGKSREDIEALVEKVLAEAGISFDEIFAAGSIDLKAEEAGLVEFIRKHSLPFITFEAKVLEAAEGEFSGSGFVKAATGVDNVCERAAMLLAGRAGKLLVRKTAENGVTVAVAEAETGTAK